MRGVLNLQPGRTRQNPTPDRVGFFLFPPVFFAPAAVRRSRIARPSERPYGAGLGQYIITQTPARATAAPITSAASGRLPSKYQPHNKDNTMKKPP